MNVNNYSQFYKGTESITNYGSGKGQKDTLVRYEFNTKDADGNTVMEKMSQAETLRVMNEISSQYGDNVIVEFSGDGLAELIKNKPWTNCEMTEEEKEERAIKEMAFQASIKSAGANPRVPYDVLKTINKSNIEAPMPNNYGALLGAKAYDYRLERDNGDPYSISWHAEDLTRAYAFMYDEIVKGHEDGTRKAYVEDANSSTGYREMTMEEELKALDDAYKKQTDMVDTLIRNSFKFEKAMKSYAEQLAKNKRVRNAESVSQEYEKLHKANETLPSDLGSKMQSVAELFKKEYQSSKMVSTDFLTQMMKNRYYLKK